ncbi:hypothetical protein C8J56DRAFT_104353 [Mycena floridula]|nr:hypothetical protein C8J56DRAFT_104353 [Mycena floridula]
MPSFPQEICEHCINFCHDSQQSLLACSLVCRAWLPASRLHLFQTVFLHESQDRTDKFLSLIRSEHQSITSCLKNLHLVGSLYSFGGLGRHSTEIANQLLVHTAYDLPRFTSVTHVGLYAMNLSYISLQPLSPLSRATVLELKSIHLRDLGQFLEAVYHFPTLEVLTLFDITWDSQETNYPPATTPSGLHHLTLISGQDTLTPVLQWLATAHIPPPLKRLNLHYPSQQNLAFVQAIITASPLILEHLTLTANQPGQEFLDLSKNTMLGRLDFEGYYHEDSECEHIISTIGSTNSAGLERISLPIFGPDVTVPLFRRIDNVICRLSSLKWLGYRGGMFNAEFFPQVISRGIVKVARVDVVSSIAFSSTSDNLGLPVVLDDLSLHFN